MRLAPRRLCAAVLAAVAAAAPGSARAAFVPDSTVNIVSGTPVYGAGAFTGSVAVDNIDPTHATVRITLTNTSSANEYITALGFSLPGTLGSGTALAASPGAAWQLLGNSTFSNGSMFDTGYFGAFDVGASIGSTWHTPAGTNPASGIAVGQTGTFDFTLVGAGANVTASALLTYLSTNNSPGIGVRFRNPGDVASALTGGVNGGKVLAVLGASPPPPNGVPAPPALLLGLVGFGGMALTRRLRPKRTA